MLRDSLEENMTVTSLDVRVNKISADVVSAIKETLLRNEESVKGKKEREKEKEKGGRVATRQTSRRRGSRGAHQRCHSPRGW